MGQSARSHLRLMRHPFFCASAAFCAPSLLIACPDDVLEPFYFGVVAPSTCFFGTLLSLLSKNAVNVHCVPNTVVRPAAYAGGRK
jgi:hypothetical protein